MTTPYEKLEYPEGQKFRVECDEDRLDAFKLGAIVTLCHDDGSKCPQFTAEDSSMIRAIFKGNLSWYEDLDCLVPID